jgi:hypothetical protein
MQTTNVLSRMVIELRQLAHALNLDEQYNEASKAQIALIAVTDIDCAGEIEIPGDEDQQPRRSQFRPADRDAISTGIKFLVTINTPDSNAAAEQLREILSRIPLPGYTT